MLHQRRCCANRAPRGPRGGQCRIYQQRPNKVITAVEVMDELIRLSKDIVTMDSEAAALGLTDF